MPSRTRQQVRNYLRLLYRDRRRLGVSILLLSLSFWITPHRLPDPIPMVPSEFLIFIWLVISMPVTVAIAPKLRHMLEVVALTDLLFSITGHVFPNSYANLETFGGHIFETLVLYHLALVLVYYALNGQWSDRLPRPKKVVRRAHLRTKLDLPVLWFSMVPTPGHADRTPEPDVVSIEYADNDRRTVRLITWTPETQAGEVLVHIDEMEVFSYVKMRLCVEHGPRTPIIEGSTIFRMSDKGAYRSFYVRHELGALPWRRVWRSWLDDTLGRMMEARLMAAEVKANKIKQRKGRKQLSLLGYGSDFNSKTSNYSILDAASSGHRNNQNYQTIYGRKPSNTERDALADISNRRSPPPKQPA